MKRPTIKDISRLAGVSPTAVSFALNGRPGISDATRERVLEIARSSGWRPSAAAIALSAGRAGALGLVIARPEETFTSERFFMRLIAGVERVLTPRSLALVLQFASDVDEELEVYRQWFSRGRVDGVLVIDVRPDDRRPVELDRLRLPFVVVGAPAGFAHPSVQVDDDEIMRQMVQHFAERGIRGLAYVAGDPSTLHTQRRMAAFSTCCAELGIDPLATRTTDYSEATGAAATTALLDGSERPRGILYDNEVLTAGGLLALTQRGIAVPGEIAVASFEDSPLCRIFRPRITAMHRDPSQLGAMSAELLLDRLAGGATTHETAAVPVLAERASTAVVSP